MSHMGGALENMTDFIDFKFYQNPLTSVNRKN